MAEARVATPKGTRNIVGSHVAAAVAEVVADLDRALARHRTASDAPAPCRRRWAWAPPAWWTAGAGSASPPTCPQAQGVDWNELIGDQLPGRTVLIENDANFAVLAEHRLGAARGHDHVVMVTLGTGIGGGLVIDGRVQVGAAGFAGEIGHMVVDPAGPPCPCGRRGCWERFASGAGLGVLAREAALAGRLGEVVRLAGGDPESVRGEDVSAAAAAGDPAAQQVIREVGWWIGFGLANLAAVLDPECFVLGGGVVQAGDLLIESARAAFAELVEGGDRRPAVVIAPAAFGERAGAVGGALAVRAGRLGLMRTGVVLPTFRDTPDEAFAAAAAAVDGRGRRRLLLRPHLAHRPARAAGAGALSDSRRAGDHARPVRRSRGGALPRHARGPGRPGPQRRAGRAVPGARAVWPRAG